MTQSTAHAILVCFQLQLSPYEADVLYSATDGAVP